MVYLNDILVYSDDLSRHTAYIQEVLRHLREAGLYCKFPKCEFGVTTCKYLGYTCPRMVSAWLQTRYLLSRIGRS
jgi:hypothetical protein